MAAPVIVQPTIGGQIAQAAGQYPEDQQKLAMQQAELDAQTIDSSSKRLAVLNKMFSSNPGMATNPQMIQAAQRAFKGLGMDAPMKNVNGVPSLDTDALYAFGPASDFMSQNMSMLLSFTPQQRASLVETMTGQQLPDGIAQRLSALPQRMISTPSELSGLYGRATQAIDTLRYPGATVEGALSIIKPINDVLQQNGMPGIDIDDLQGAGLYQALLNQANLQGLQGKAAKEYADTNLANVRTALAPAELQVKQQNAAAHTVSANAAATNASAHVTQANAYAARTPAAIAKDYADADQAEAHTRQIVQQVATGGATLKDLETNANNAQALVARLESDLNDPQQGLQAQITAYKAAHPDATVQNDTQLKGLNTDAYEVEQRIERARKAATTAQSAFQSGQTRLHKGSTGHSGTPSNAPPFDVPHGYRAEQRNGKWGVVDGSGNFYPWQGTHP